MNDRAVISYHLNISHQAEAIGGRRQCRSFPQPIAERRVFLNKSRQISKKSAMNDTICRKRDFP